MKRIILPRSIALTVSNQDEDGNRVQQPINAKAVLSYALVDQGERGLTILELRKRWRALDVIEGAKDGTLDFEDEDYATLKGVVEAMRWPWLHKDVGLICDAVENAETVRPGDVPGLNRKTKRRVSKKESANGRVRDQREPEVVGQAE